MATTHGFFIFNPFMFSGFFFYPWKLDSSIHHLRGMSRFLYANSVDPDQMPQSVASDLGLHFLSMSLSRDARHLKG